VETLTPEEELRQLLLSQELDLLARLDERVAELLERVGDDETLQSSMRRVIVDVLRDAGVEEHERLSNILAPLMLSSLRAEIRGSRDMMVEALYPLTGRLVSAAVRNAFREFLQTLDQKVSRAFSFSHMQIRMKALLSRRSVGELMLERFPPFGIDEILVIHRPTGLLIAGTGDKESVDRDLVGSMLNAVMSLTKDAFVEGGSGELSTLEFGGAQLFVRSSPALVLVVVTNGVPPRGMETRLENLFVGFLDTWGRPLSEFDGDLDAAQEKELIADLDRRSTELLSEAEVAGDKGSFLRPFLAIALVAIVLGSWLGVRAWSAYQVTRIEAAARAVIDSQVDLIGFPIEVRFNREDSVLYVAGLTPDVAARDALIEALQGDVGVELDLVLSPLSFPDPIADLQLFSRQNAIYFTDGTNLRAPEQAEETLQELARLLIDTPPHVRLRLSGYADALGNLAVNEALTAGRARFAFDRLVALGVAPERMTIVGRPGERFLSQEVGSNSDSRRVEFEVYFTER
jgi:outer membrane protein OmpA-like peptidoglycan-associated protein